MQSPEEKLRRLQKQLSTFTNLQSDEEEESDDSGDEKAAQIDEKGLLRQAVEDAAAWNVWLMYERSARSAFYVDPHTQTTQVLGSWHVSLDSPDEVWLRQREIIANRFVH